MLLLDEYMACGWLVALLHCCNITMFLCFFKEPNTHSKAKDSDKISLLHNSVEEKEKEEEQEKGKEKEGEEEGRGEKSDNNDEGVVLLQQKRRRRRVKREPPTIISKTQFLKEAGKKMYVKLFVVLLLYILYIYFLNQLWSMLLFYFCTKFFVLCFGHYYNADY